MAEEQPRRPAAPSGLGTAGRKLWRDLTGVYEFAAHERRLVEAACRTVDTLAALEDRVAGDGVMVTGSQGQEVLHPAIGEARQQRLALHKLLAALDLPDPEDDEGQGSVPSPTQLRGRKAAEARWHGRRERHEQRGRGARGA